MTTRAPPPDKFFSAAASSRSQSEGGQTMPTSGSGYLLAGQMSELERLQPQWPVWEPAGQALLDRLGSGQGLRALDVGCSCFGWLRLLSQWVGPGGSVTGTDVDVKLLEAARALNQGRRAWERGRSSESRPMARPNHTAKGWEEILRSDRSRHRVARPCSAAAGFICHYTGVLTGPAR